MQNFKIYLLLLFINCCILIGYFAWEYRKPEITVEQTYLNGYTCYADGQSWPARRYGECFMEDKPKLDLRGKVYDKDGNLILCTNGNKSFAPQKGICID